MKSFLSKYTYLIIWIVAIIIVGVGFVFIVEPSINPRSGSSGNNAPAAAPAVPPAPAAPSVNLTIVKSKTGNSLVVQWANLPANTTALDIFRGLTNSTSSWSLWRSVTLTGDELADGNMTFSLGNTPTNGYSFYVEGVNGTANGTSTGSGAGSNPDVLWTSPVTEPPVATSTPSGTGNSGGAPPGVPTSTPTSTQPSAPAPSSTASSTPQGSPSSTASGTSASGPSNPGTPYYNPAVQVQGYSSAQTNNFWVQYLNKNIEIGWQNLPPDTGSAVVLRSADDDGPWTSVFTQQNPSVNAAYSIQLVDDTLGTPYYYELKAVTASATLAIYGPLYLPGYGQ